MLTFLGDRQSNPFCDGMTRRNFLSVGGLAMGGIGLPNLLLAERQNNIGSSNKIFKNLKKGIFMNLLNPKIFLFLALFFPNFLFSDEFSFKTQIFILGNIFILITFLVFAVIILFSDLIFRKFSQNDNFKIFAKYFNISVLMLIALLILFTENNITLS